MSGVHESRLSLPKHIGRKNRIAIGLVLHLESYIRISIYRYYQCFNDVSIRAYNFQTLYLLLMRCFLYYVIKLLTLLGLQL